MKKCPYCAREIQDEAAKCRHCKEWLINHDYLEKKVDQHADVKSKRKYNPDVKVHFLNMSIDELITFKETYKESEFTEEAQESIRQVFNERKNEIEKYEKSIKHDERTDFRLFKSTRSKAKIVLIFFAIIIILNLVSIVSNSLQVDLLNRIQWGDYTEWEVNTNDNRQQYIGILLIVFYLLNAIFFLIWFYHSYKNLYPLGATKLKYSPGWTIGGFFVPFLNLVRPYQVMKELWLESVPFSNQSFTSDPKSNRPMSLIGWWWSAYLLGNFVGYFLVKMIGSETIESLITFTWTSGVGDIIDIIAAIITIKMVYIIVRFQEEKFKTIQIV